MVRRKGLQPATFLATVGVGSVLQKILSGYEMEVWTFSVAFAKLSRHGHAQESRAEVAKARPTRRFKLLTDGMKTTLPRGSLRCGPETEHG
jgi:hypothetical protein